MSETGLFPAAPDPYAGRACRATGLQAQAVRRPSRLTHRHSDGLHIDPSSPCPLTLICSSFATSRLGRCVFAAAFFIWGYVASYLFPTTSSEISILVALIRNVEFVVTSHNTARKQLRAPQKFTVTLKSIAVFRFDSLTVSYGHVHK
jgi:hypothetical protein